MHAPKQLIIFDPCNSLQARVSATTFTLSEDSDQRVLKLIDVKPSNSFYLH